MPTPEEIWAAADLPARRLAGVALNPSSPEDVLLRLLADGPPAVRMVLGRDRILPDAVVGTVLKHPDTRTRSFFARNPHVDRPVSLRRPRRPRGPRLGGPRPSGRAGNRGAAHPGPGPRCTSRAGTPPESSAAAADGTPRRRGAGPRRRSEPGPGFGGDSPAGGDAGAAGPTAATEPGRGTPTAEPTRTPDGHPHRSPRRPAAPADRNRPVRQEQGPRSSRRATPGRVSSDHRCVQRGHCRCTTGPLFAIR